MYSIINCKRSFNLIYTRHISSNKKSQESKLIMRYNCTSIFISQSIISVFKPLLVKNSFRTYTKSNFFSYNFNITILYVISSYSSSKIKLVKSSKAPLASSSSSSIVESFSSYFHLNVNWTFHSIYSQGPYRLFLIKSYIILFWWSKQCPIVVYSTLKYTIMS